MNKQGMHPYLPHHLQGLRGAGLRRANHLPFGPGSHTRLNVDSTMSVQGLRGTWPTEAVRAANPDLDPGRWPDGTTATLTQRTDGSGTEYVIRDAEGNPLRSGVSQTPIVDPPTRTETSLSWWRMPLWGRVALIGGGALLVAGGAYALYRRTRRRRR
jgi:hypothetical protein